MRNLLCVCVLNLLCVYKTCCVYIKPAVCIKPTVCINPAHNTNIEQSCEKPTIPTFNNHEDQNTHFSRNTEETNCDWCLCYKLIAGLCTGTET